MGRWSRHPMGSDGALDAQSELTVETYDYCEANGIDYYSEEGRAELTKYLNNISLDDLKKLVNESECLSKDSFVVPYTYLEYGINRPELKEFLIECFNNQDDITGDWNYCSEIDENGEVIEVSHINYFKNNFDAIMAGEIELPDDPGLLAAIAGHSGTGLINKL